MVGKAVERQPCFPFGRNPTTGGAWPSSARVVRCWVKSRNERNPCPYLLPLMRCSIRRLPATSRRKEGTTSGQYALYALGYTGATVARTMSGKSASSS